MGFEEDVNLKGDNYQWLGGMFYIGRRARIENIVNVIGNGHSS